MTEVEAQESERVRQVAKDLAEHFDAVEILVSRHDSDGTRTISKGAGNWHARLGLIREWTLNVEEQIRQEGREIARKDEL